MKLILPLMLLASVTAHAQTLEVRASQVTCAELQRTLAENGALIVVKKILFFKDKTFVRHSDSCSSDQYKKTFTFKTIDEKHCEAGEICRYIPTPSEDTGYSGGSSSDYGGYYGGGTSGWSSGGGSSYDPPSSSDRGSRYDPPSSSDRGPRYDPPSSGDRGSRYCPSC